MKGAIANLQRQVFMILLYGSSIAGIVCDFAGLENRSVVFAAWEAMMLFLVMFSLYYVPKGYALLLSLLVMATVLNIINSNVSLLISLNGVRDTLMFFVFPIFYYKVFAEGNEEETAKYITLFKKFCWFFLFIQVPASLSQYIRFGASDSVGGTYGSGNGGSLTMIIICVVFFLFQFPMPAWKKLLLFLLLSPLMLNETKISFVLIPMLGVFIFFEPKLKNMLLAGLGGAAFLFLASQLYVHQQANVGDSIFSIFDKDFLNDYLLSYDEMHPDIPRFTRMILGYNILSQDNFMLFFGVEYGMFRGSASGATSQFAQNYNWLLSGTRPYIFFILMQGGMIMVAGTFLIVAKMCNNFKHINKQTVFYLLMFLIVLIYTDSYRWHNFLVIFMFVLFFVNSEYFKSKAYLNEDSDSFH